MTYSEEQLKELLKKQRELCAKSAIVDEDWYRGRFSGCILRKDSILNAPEPPLPEIKQSPLKRFGYFPNHGDEDGRNGFTICYDWENSDEIIVWCEDTEEDAIEAVKRLNGILENIITPLQQAPLPVVNTEEEVKALAFINKIKYPEHYMGIPENATREDLLFIIAGMEEGCEQWKAKCENLEHTLQQSLAPLPVRECYVPVERGNKSLNEMMKDCVKIWGFPDMWLKKVTLPATEDWGRAKRKVN